MKDKRHALLSVSDKTGIVDLATALVRMGYTILSTGGTATTLREAGVEVTDVSEYTGSKEGMDGRLKTLHPKVHGALLGRVGVDDDFMRELGIELIDVLVVNLYPFQETVAKGCTFEEAVEKIDIGGPAMIRAACKNHERVTVLTHPDQYVGFLEDVDEHGNTTPAFRFHMMRDAFMVTQTYDTQITSYMFGHPDAAAHLKSLI